MKRIWICLLFILAFFVSAQSGLAADSLPQTPADYAASDYAVYAAKIAVGVSHTAVVKPDGTVTAWGNNDYHQCDVPAGLTGVKCVAAGENHTLALKDDGTIAAWGCTRSDVNNPITIPAEVQAKQGQIKAIAAGLDMSAVITQDGQVIVWGYNNYNLASVPSGLGNVMAVAISDAYAVALNDAGNVTVWGSDTIVPDGLSGNVVAVASGPLHWLALKKDGTVVVAGFNDHVIQCNGIEGKGNVRAIGGGRAMSVALTVYAPDDASVAGTVYAWGMTPSGNYPSGGLGTVYPDGVVLDRGAFSDLKVIAIASDSCGTSNGSIVYALLEDGTLYGWSRADAAFNSKIPAGLNLIDFGSVSLSGLAVAGYALDPVFNAATTAYTVAVPTDVTGVSVTAAAADANAVLQLNGAVVASGAACAVDNLALGDNPVAVVVTATDGTSRTYTINVYRTPPSMAGLISGLNVGNITTLVGTGNGAFKGDGDYCTIAEIYMPRCVAFDRAGNMYIADYGNNRIRKVDTNGIITTVAGTGTSGYSGDNGPATSAKINGPCGVAADAAGNLYIAELSNNRIRMVAAESGTKYNIQVTAGNIYTVAGDGTASFGGDNGPATSAKLNGPRSVSVDSAGNLFISDSGNNRVRKMDTGGIISTVAGNGTAGYGGDNGPATGAQLKSPRYVAFDAAGNFYIADYSNNRVRKVDTGGIITTVAGDGTAGYGGDGGQATSAMLNKPYSGVVDAAGNIYIADYSNNRIRKVDTGGTIITVAGDGTAGSSGDNGLATSAKLTPTNVGLDSAGNLYIADNGNYIRYVKLQVADTNAPTWTGGSLTTSGVGQTGVTLSWSGASDNEGITGYNIYQGGNLLTTVSGTTATYAVTGLNAGVQYTFKVEAGDAAGNWSSDGPSATVTTANVPVVAISGVPAAATLYTGGTHDISATVDPAGATLSYASSNTSVATVSAGGIITAVAPGSADITVTATMAGYTPATATVAVAVANVAPAGVGKVKINGAEVQTDVSLIEMNGVILVPVRCVADALEVQADWNAAAQQITFTSSDKVLVLTADSISGTLNGNQFSLPAPMIIYNDRAMVPLQSVVEAFGGTIEVINGTAAAPTVFPGSGAVAAGTQLVLKTATSGATIHYTLDGSTPAASSPAYNGPITINAAVTLKAIAIKDGMDDSVVLTASYTIAEPINSTTVAVSTSNKDLAITQDTLNLGAPVTVNVPNTVTDARVSVAALMNMNSDGTITTGDLPALNITVDTAVSATDPVQVDIPAGAKVDAPAEWNGAINVPRVQENTTVSVTPDAGKTASVSTVIEIGFGDVPLTFSKAVRILIPGQAGKDAGYSRAGVFTKITTVMSADSQAAGDALPAGGEGKIDVGSDLVIWTKHFTQFVTYTQSSVSTGGGGGGGGATTPSAVNSTTGSATVTPGAGGAISLGSEAAIEVPANALTGTDKVEVKVQKVAAPPALPAGFKLAGSVYEFSVGGKNSYSFAKNVTIKLSFDPGIVSAGGNPSIKYYDEAKGQWVNLGGTVSGNYITAKVDHFTKFAVMAAEQDEEKDKAQLKDISSHWAYNNINKLVSMNSVNGYPDGSFKPDNTITRAEFAAILVKTFKLTQQSGKTFTDTAGHWAEEYIAAAAASGVVSGYDANTFGPDDLITREQMAVMIVRAAKLSSATEEIPFADSGSISDWAREAFAAAAVNGIMKGYPDNTVQPQGNATRAEAVTMIVNAL